MCTGLSTSKHRQPTCEWRSESEKGNIITQAVANNFEFESMTAEQNDLSEVRTNKRSLAKTFQGSREFHFCGIVIPGSHCEGDQFE